MWICGWCETHRGGRLRAAAESAPRVLATILGGIIGGAMVGLIGWTGATLFGYK
jgi:hypothetical protein